jgi:hypothetical protein
MIHQTRFIVLVLFSVCLTGCEQVVDLFTPDQDWTVDMQGAQTLSDVFARTAKLQYQYSDNWPTPPQVHASQQADCKGYSIYAIQMLHQLGYDAQFVVASIRVGGVDQVEPHAMVFCGGQIYEPQSPTGAIPEGETIEHTETWSYSKLRDYVKAEYATGHGRGLDSGVLKFR